MTSNHALNHPRQATSLLRQPTFAPHLVVQDAESSHASMPHAHPLPLPPSSDFLHPLTPETFPSDHEEPSESNDQGDGSPSDLFDWRLEVSKRREAAFRGRGRNDKLVRQYVNLKAMEEQGNGPMRPFPGWKNLGAKPKQNVILDPLEVPEGAVIPRKLAMAPYDGPDENTINSDLDDSGDEIGDEDTDESQLILCTHEKVHRVRSKFKCILRDGVMTINDKM